ncbi:unnamed protein product [Ectocarpus sp. 12 AP-2014]
MRIQRARAWLHSRVDVHGRSCCRSQLTQRRVHRDWDTHTGSSMACWARRSGRHSALATRHVRYIPKHVSPKLFIPIPHRWMGLSNPYTITPSTFEPQQPQRIRACTASLAVTIPSMALVSIEEASISSGSVAFWSVPSLL